MSVIHINNGGEPLCSAQTEIHPGEKAYISVAHLASVIMKLGKKDKSNPWGNWCGNCAKIARKTIPKSGG